MPYSGEVSDQRTVRVATCHDPAEATVIRAVLSAHGIEAMIPGEGAHSVGTAAVGFVTHVFVDAGDAEDAAALIAGMRDDTPAGDADAGADDDDGPWDGTVDVAVVVDRRKRLGAAVLLSLAPTFGTGHMSTGAWKRGIGLAAVEFVGIRHAVAGNKLGLVLVVAAVLVDLIGAVVRVRRRGAPASLPAARLRRAR